MPILKNEHAQLNSDLLFEKVPVTETENTKCIEKPRESLLTKSLKEKSLQEGSQKLVTGMSEELNIKMLKATHIKNKSVSDFETLEHLNEPTDSLFAQNNTIYSGLKKWKDIPESQTYSLLDYVEKNKKLNECDAKKIFKQILSIIEEYQNRENTTHAQLKAENILINVTEEQTSVKLADSKATILLSKSQQRSPSWHENAYTAPEVLLEKNICAQSDMWTLGVLLYFMVTGRFPFLSSSDIIKGVYAQLDHVSADCKDVIRLLLCVNIKERACIKKVLNHSFVMEKEETSLPKMRRVKKCMNLQELGGEFEVKETELMNKLEIRLL